MAKRARDDTLTGGTGDVNKNFIWFDHPVPGASTADVLNVSSFAFPIPPGGPGVSPNPNLVTVVELLGVSQQVTNPASFFERYDANFGNFYSRLSMGGTDNPGSSVQNSNTPTNRCFFNYEAHSGASVSAIAIALVAGGPGIAPTHEGIDLTDRAGHGIILYGNTITSNWVSAGGASPVETMNLRYCITYRLKRVTLQDYLAGSASMGGVLTGTT